MKLGKPMLKGAFAGAVLGIGASFLAEKFVPNNQLVSYGASFIAGGTPGLVGKVGADFIGGTNPLAMLSKTTATNPYQY